MRVSVKVNDKLHDWRLSGAIISAEIGGIYPAEHNALFAGAVTGGFAQALPALRLSVSGKVLKKSQNRS
tara:strand:+ start:125 stop:331 length:207 start_codon:yes stop_codon:yes gene_type:complete